MTAGIRALAAGFPVPALDAWQAAVAKLVEGGEGGLDRRTPDGLPVRPLYRSTDAPVTEALLARDRIGAWEVRQPVDHPDPRVAGERARDELAGGTDRVLLRVDDAPGSRAGVSSGGTRLHGPDDLAAFLAGARLDQVPLAIDAGGRSSEVASLLLDLHRRQGLPPASFDVPLGCDPLGAAARGAPVDPGAGVALAVTTTLRCEAEGVPATALLADGTPYHAGGAGAALELACALAAAIVYLRALDGAGLPPERAASRIAFRLAADSDVFTTMAKLRAARRLWGRATAACGVPDAPPLRLEAVTSARMLSRRDVHVNLLRATAAAFAAAAGGADAITVLPFDAALGGKSTPEARRLARNVQLILREESGLHRVLDPGAGSFFAEALTDGLAREAWALMRWIEGEGGLPAALARGSVQERVAAAWAERAAAVARRDEPITGVSEFPNLADPAPANGRLLASAGDEAPSGDHREAAAAAAFRVAPIPERRLAEAFESLRDRADARLARTGRRPAVFLAQLGGTGAGPNVAFARNLFAAGGLASVAADPAADANALASSFRDAATPIAAICGAGEVLGTQAADAARTLKSAGAARVWLVGRPDEGAAAALAEAGVDRVVRAGDDDVLAVLEDAHLALGEAA